MENNKLQHSGIKGMKWGIRRFQNKDGSLTPAGKKRYNDDVSGDGNLELRRPKNARSLASSGQSKVNRLFEGIGKATVISAGVLAAAHIGKQTVRYIYAKSVLNFLNDIDV